MGKRFAGTLKKRRNMMTWRPINIWKAVQSLVFREIQIKTAVSYLKISNITKIKTFMGKDVKILKLS